MIVCVNVSWRQTVRLSPVPVQHTAMHCTDLAQACLQLDSILDIMRRHVLCSWPLPDFAGDALYTVHVSLKPCVCVLCQLPSGTLSGMLLKLPPKCRRSGCMTKTPSTALHATGRQMSLCPLTCLIASVLHAHSGEVRGAACLQACRLQGHTTGTATSVLAAMSLVTGLLSSLRQPAPAAHGTAPFPHFTTL